MAIDTSQLEIHADEWSPVEWAFHVWSWLVLLALFIALELWVDPFLASFVVCLKLGWRDIWAAIKLRHHNLPAVAGAIRLYCLAQACFKVAFGSIALVAVVIAIEGLIGVAPQFDRFIIGLPLVIVMLFAGMFFVFFAAGQSGTNRVPCWLDGTIYRSLLKHGSQAKCHGTFNHVPWLIWIGLLLVSAIFLPGPVAAIAILVLKGVPWGFPGGIMFTLIWI